MTKATLRLPDPLVEMLRERSKQEGRSLNAVAVDALWRGLGSEPDDDLSSMLGSFVTRRARAIYRPAEVEKAVAELGEEARHLSHALDWTRGDR